MFNFLTLEMLPMPMVSHGYSHLWQRVRVRHYFSRSSSNHKKLLSKLWKKHFIFQKYSFTFEMLCMLCIFLKIHFSIAFFIFGHFQTGRQTMKHIERQITEDNLWLLIYNHKNKMNTIFYTGQNQCHSTGVKIILFWPYLSFETRSF